MKEFESRIRASLERRKQEKLEAKANRILGKKKAAPEKSRKQISKSVNKISKSVNKLTKGKIKLPTPKKTGQGKNIERFF